MMSRGRVVLSSFVLSLFAVGIMLLILILYLPSQAASATYTVNSTADTNDGTCNAANCTLREAILAANDTPDADTIVFSLPPSSTITLNGTQLPPITGTLSIDGSTAENLTISGDNASRVLVIGPEPPPYPGPSVGPIDAAVGSSAVVTLTNLHITEGNESNDLGGGIYNGGTLNIVNSTFSFLTSKHGGIFSDHTLVITNSTFISNSISTTYGSGAGIYNSSNGNVAIANSAFFTNTVNASQANGGGAIYNKGVVTVTNSIFSGNHSDWFGGGAIYSISPGILNVTSSVFTKNSAEFGGGGIVASGIVTITNSTFDSNFSDYGGAVRTFGVVSQIDILNSTFTNNTADNNGGAIHTDSNMNVTNSTFSGNSSQSGGAILILDFEGELTIRNSTITRNTAVGFGGGIFNQGILNFSNTIIANSMSNFDCTSTGTIGTNINNLVEDGSCNPDFTGDPMLGPLQDNGGDTFTHALLAGSPAIDNGHSATCAASPVNNLDQRGVIRPIDGDGDGMAICDIGSYEAERFDLILSKNGPGVAAVGEFITYTLVVGNKLTDTLTNVVLTDTLPANANYISGGTLVGNVVSWTVPSLSGGASFTGSFVVTASQTITNDDYRVSANEGYSTTGNTAVVTIVAEPISGLAASNDSPTIIGNLTTLTATVSGGSDISYIWILGDGTMGNGPNISHQYPSVGQYPAIVTATNPLGVETAFTIVDIIDEAIIGLAAGNDGPTVLGESTLLFASVSTGTNVVYSWDFGDGTTGSGAFVSHTYPDVGVYTAIVTATNSTNSQSTQTIVTITDVPISGLSAGNDGPTTVGDPTILTASVSAGTNVNYAWSFGDGTFGSGAIVMHTYPDVGQYTAVVTASNSVGEAVATTNVTIENDDWAIYMPVVLNGSGNSQQGSVPAPIVDKNIMTPQINKVAVKPRRQVMPIG